MNEVTLSGILQRFFLIICVECTMLGGEEWGLGARGVFLPRGHELDRSNMFISQLPQTSLSVLDHLLHHCMLVKRLPYLGLTDQDKDTEECQGATDTEEHVEHRQKQWWLLGNINLHFNTCS